MRYCMDAIVGWKLALIVCWIVETLLSYDLLFGW